MQKIYFAGIGGAGMAPLAAIAMDKDCRVAGADREPNAKTAELARHGAEIYDGHNAANIAADTDLLVYSSAVPPENPERLRAAELGIPQLRRGEFLAVLAAKYRRCVAISGSHGKTSVTSMLVFILDKCRMHPGYLIGGVVPGLPSGSAGRDDDIFVTEADESDGTHTALHPFLGIVPNADDDHSWSVGGEKALRENFRTFARQSKHLIYYGDGVPADWFAFHPAATVFDEHGIPQELAHWHGFQRRNAALAVAAAELLGVKRAEAIDTLGAFPGVDRRMTVHFATPDFTVIEDYAHHPKELAASIDFLREKYPQHHLRLLFQPHRYARLAKYFNIMADELRRADSVIVAPVFAAWTEKGTVGSAELAAKIGGKAHFCDAAWPELAALAAAMPNDGRPLALAVIGAGDIEKVFAYLPGIRH